MPLFTEDLDLHLTHGSLGLPESLTQAASRSVQLIFAGPTSVTDRQTDLATRSVTVGRIYVRTTYSYCDAVCDVPRARALD